MNVFGFLAGAALATAGCQRYWVCDEAASSRVAELPTRLSATGLYADIATAELAPDVSAYAPKFELWSDGAEKQRWILLPNDQQIDTSDLDEWTFPEGTRVWKQFSIAGVPIETRLIAKLGPTDSDWASLAYVWDEDGQDATAAPLGEVDSHHTTHDVPASGECVACHGGRRSFVLGFSAVQLAGVAATNETTLDDLIDEDRLSQPPTSNLEVPGNSTEVAALGYFHANCSHCHNSRRPERSGARCFDPEDGLDFTLTVEDLGDPESTATYRTAIGEAVKRGDPDESRLYELMRARGMFQQMPPLATEKVDAVAVAGIRSWIEGL